MIEPEPVVSWPPGPGWYVIAGLAILLFCYLAYKMLIHRQRNKYRRSGLKELESIKLRVNEIGFPESVKRLNTLMKRVALSGFSREKVASLSGDKWLAFLSATCKKTDFSSSPGTLLYEVTFRKPDKVEIDSSAFSALTSLCAQWIKGH